MQLITGYKDLSNTKGVVCTIGSFDGVHQGHHYLIQYTNRIAHQQGLKSLIITFRNHPRKTLCPKQPTWLLSTYEEKLRLISQLSPDYCMVLDFNEHLSQLSANEFILSYLKPLNVKPLSWATTIISVMNATSVLPITIVYAATMTFRSSMQISSHSNLLLVSPYHQPIYANSSHKATCQKPPSYSVTPIAYTEKSYMDKT